MRSCKAALALAITTLVLSAAASVMGATVPLRGDFPAGALDDPVPVSGGIPFPKGSLKSAENIRLLGANGRELPCQVTRTAVWPDGSVKWVMVDAVLSPAAAKALKLEYGAAVRRAAVRDPLKAEMQGDGAAVSGGGISAAIKKSGGGVLDEFSLGGRSVIAADRPARLVVNTLRIPDGTSGKALPAHTYVCRDTSATLDVGKVAIDEVAIESPGPIRVTVRVRGRILLPRFGSTMPARVLQGEGSGKMPFSMRLSFYRGTGVVYGQHQIIFAGEPDCDYIARWGIELPGLAGSRGTVVLEPGVELAQENGTLSVAREQTRLCWAPVKGGFAMIRKGWENRPCAVTRSGGAAWIDFWPTASGVWDLRRYAREWAVGESGNPRDAAAMKRYAKYAARGIAKSHNFVISLGKGAPAGAAPDAVKALAGRAMLVAPPSWYGSTLALGPFAPEQTTGAHARLDASTRREMDYHLYCQDLFNWYGKIDFGFWQTRFGTIHRHDRWDRDYGRWGWSLNDGAGRVGHILMLQYLRTLERRYLEAGEAFNRINYDTNMVHTKYHLENTKNWWTTTGCSHRHNVQPFGCPYIGMRGSYPVGQRIVHLLTGDGVIADGLDIVSEAGYVYVNGNASRLCNSGGSDGQGSASNALLWKYETTGDRKYLAACRKILDKSGLVPPTGGRRLGYGPSFGLFNAAGEYAMVSGDKAFQQRVIELAKKGATQKKPGQFVYAMAIGYHLTKDGALRSKIASVLTGMAGARSRSLAGLAPERWPGHCGWSSPSLNANQTRDYPYGIGVLTPAAGAGEWPELKPSLKPVPGALPEKWYGAAGAQTEVAGLLGARALLRVRAPAGGGEITAGKAKWKLDFNLADKVGVGAASPLAEPIAMYVTLARPKDGDARLADKLETHKGVVSKVGAADDGGVLATGKAGPATFAAKLSATEVDGVSGVRVEVACRVPAGGGRVASWGLQLPLKMGPNANLIQTTAPGRFRLERCRLDQNDERVPAWLAAMERRENLPHWPKWRLSGLSIGPGQHYRIWRASEASVSPVFCEMGTGGANWFDLTDRGADPRWGVTVRMLRPGEPASDASRLAVRANLVSGLVQVQFHDQSAEPLDEKTAAAGLSGAADIIFHDGWRPPLSKPQLTPAQYRKFVDDLNYGGLYGLCAYRFRLSRDHRVKGRQWMERIRDHGVEPREILYGMQWRDGLKKHCEKLGVAYDAEDIEGSVSRIVGHYRE